MAAKRYLMTGMTPNPGGVEAYIMNLVRHLDPDKVRFDYLVNFEEPIAYEQELRDMGSKIIRLPGRRKHPIHHQIEYRKFFRSKNERYDGIYCNLLSLANIDDLTYAKKSGFKRIIAHSHNADDSGWDIIGIRKRLHQSHQKTLKRYTEKLFACSEQAGAYMFGKDAKFEIIHNAIDADRFRFDEKRRNTVRKELKIPEDARVYGTVGRMEEQKNPLFLIKIFRELHRRDRNSRFIHVGDGSMRGEIEKKLREYGLDDCYTITGRVSDSSGYYQAMDAFLLPSLYEGLPVALVEAQAADLPCFLADTISDETRIIGEKYHKLPLEKQPLGWADMIASGATGTGKDLNAGTETEAEETEFVSVYNRRDVSDRIKTAGYDIIQAAKKMEDYLYHG